jgi:hypothetical protein
MSALLFCCLCQGTHAAQLVYLDFDTYVSPDGYAYTPADKALIKTGLEAIYGPPGGFGLTFTTTLPAATHSSVYFNFGVGAYGGTSDHIDFHNSDDEDDAYVLAPPLLSALSVPVTPPNIVRASTNLAAHELGHILGLRHYDSFGPPLGGMPAGIGAGFDPPYPGPASASLTSEHIMSLASTVSLSAGTIISSDLHLGFREAIKLKMMGVMPDPELPGIKTPLMPQTMSFEPIAVPNTMIGHADGPLFGMPTYSVRVDSIEGTLSPDPDAPLGSPVLTDYYKFTGAKDEIVTIEVMSAMLSWRFADITDPVVFLLDSAGLPVGTYFMNDDEYESTDSMLLDIALPYSGTYFIEVGPFDALDPMSAGAYDLFVYRYTVIPEPGSLLLAGLGAIAIVVAAMKRKYRE